MELDPVLLSRVQFALTIGFHYLFPPLTIGLGVQMVIMEGLYLRTRDRQYEAMAKFWTKLFALIFAMGVATGIVMEFQFGTNWATYSRYVGDIFGSVLAAEGIFAFFLESGFLAVLAFGWERVSPAMHFFSTIMVSLGSIFSAIWIIVANSWQQTPAGFHLVGEGLARRAEITDFWAVVFNPSTVDRLIHTLIGAFILGGFFVMSVSAYYLLKGRHVDFARRSIRIALPFALVFSIAALVSGHSNARMVGRHQPSKLAAFEGHFQTRDGGTPLYLFGYADEQQERVRFGLAVPGMLSWLLYDDAGRPVPALDDPAIIPGAPTTSGTPVPPGREAHRVRDHWPPVNLTFQLYHAMVGLGMLFIVLTVYAGILLWRGTLFAKQWLLKVLVVAVAGPMLANQLGWAAAEVGRQPWIVWGLLRTSDAASKAVSGGEVLASIIMFSLIYLLLLLAWLFIMDSKITAGPESPEDLARHAERRSLAAAAAARTAGHTTDPGA